MCGRYSALFTEALALVLFEDLDVLPKQLEIEWSANVAPTDEAPIVVTQSGARLVLRSKFGFEMQELGKTVPNARSETLAEKKTFARALRERRCLVIADGYYEWTGPAKARKPHFVSLPDREPMLLAGLYREEQRPSGTTLSHVVLTAEAGEAIRPLHDREPVIVSAAARDTWLSSAHDESVLARVLATRRRDLVHWEVDPRVNRPAPKDPALREPYVAAPPKQGSLF